MQENLLPPDERALRSHIESPAFVTGVEKGKWHIIGDLDWPILMVAVSASPREYAPSEFYFQFDLTGYPASPPTAAMWDQGTGKVLEPNLYPKGKRAGNVLRIVWPDKPCIYAPFDRLAIDPTHGGHPDWPQKYPHHAWNSKRDLAWVLRYLHELLNDDDYTGIQ